MTETDSDGYVPTPAPITDYLVSHLFGTRLPNADDRVLLPGCGTGQFAAAIARCASYRGHPCPDFVGIELDSDRASVFRERFAATDSPHKPPIPDKSARQLDYTYPPDWSPDYNSIETDMTLYERDYLLEPPSGSFEYIIMNPPFIRYQELPDEKRAQYKHQYETAFGQFNSYAPFMEQACRQLADDGQLIAILPDQFLFSQNAALRDRLRKESVHHVWPLPEATFPNHEVRTCFLSLTADPNIGLNSRFCVDWWHYQSDLRTLLSDLPTDSEPTDDDIGEYVSRAKNLKKTLQMRQRTEGRDGGYQSVTNPRTSNSEPVQADLGEWA